LNNSAPSFWWREDDLHVLDFAFTGGVMYALADNIIYEFDDPSGADFEWYATTEIFNNGYLGNTITKKVKVEAKLEEGAAIDVYMKTQDDFELIDTYNYYSANRIVYKTYRVDRAERFQFKFVGRGQGKILSFARETITGSDV
jgi:hypothetical protein